jgi:hypothetical protein
VPEQCERQLLRWNADAVVRNADQARAAALDSDCDRARPGIERVLDELFDDGRRPLDDLAGRDLVDEL